MHDGVKGRYRLMQQPSSAQAARPEHTQCCFAPLWVLSILAIPRTVLTAFVELGAEEVGCLGEFALLKSRLCRHHCGHCERTLFFLAPAWPMLTRAPANCLLDHVLIVPVPSPQPLHHLERGAGGRTNVKKRIATKEASQRLYR